MKPYVGQKHVKSIKQGSFWSFRSSHGSDNPCLCYEKEVSTHLYSNYSAVIELPITGLLHSSFSSLDWQNCLVAIEMNNSWSTTRLSDYTVKLPEQNRNTTAIQLWVMGSKRVPDRFQTRELRATNLKWKQREWQATGLPPVRLVACADQSHCWHISRSALTVSINSCASSVVIPAVAPFNYSLLITYNYL